MDPIPQINPIDSGIQHFGIQNIGIRNNQIRNIRLGQVRSLEIEQVPQFVPPGALPSGPPVVTVIGTPIVNMPGCVKVHTVSYTHLTLPTKA